MSGHGDPRGGGLTRRDALNLAAGTAAAVVVNERWVFAVQEGGVVKAVSDGAEGWSPRLLEPRQGEALARLVDLLIPRTETPGARDARVHEYIDLALSLEELPSRKVFVKGLRWLDPECQKRSGADLVAASEADVVAVLRSVSDEHSSHATRLARGAEFFADLKRRTIFGYYTSLEGRVEELALPEVVSMEKWSGCRHPGSDHG